MISIDQKEAVYLFNDRDVAHGYWLSDFERLVRDKIPFPGYDNEKVKAAYVVIGPQEFAQAMVLFYLPISAQGFVESGWYLPLKRLAGGAGHGPNMGDGRIRLACQSQCSISWHQNSLWEPVTSDFMAIRKAIRDNLIGSQPLERAGVDVEEVASSAPIQGGSLIAGAMSRRHSDPDVEQLKSLLRTETLAYRNQLQQLQREIERQKAVTERAKYQVVDDESSEVIQALKQELSELKQLQAHEMQGYQAKIEQLTEQVENPVKADVDVSNNSSAHDASANGHNKLDVRVDELSVALKDAQERSVEQFIQRMDALEAVVVCFHPGAGHLTIPANSMQAYAKNPTAYAAQKCHVTEVLYGAWLDHYDDPKCRDCSVEIPRVENPQDFQPKQHEFCTGHGQL